MPLSNDILTYRDVETVLAAAATNGVGGRYRLGSAREAHAWRARANKFRRLAHDPMFSDLVLTLEDLPSGECDVVIKTRTIGTLLALDGETPVDVPDRPQKLRVDSDDPLLLEALKIVDEATK